METRCVFSAVGIESVNTVRISFGFTGLNKRNAELNLPLFHMTTR